MMEGALTMAKKEKSFSNEIHQLLVTVSRHLYLDKKGAITYQKKPTRSIN